MNMVDYYINTIYDRQNENNFFYHYNMFEYIHDFEIFFWKVDDDTLEYVILDSIVHLYLID